MDVKDLKGIGPKTLTLLNKIGIFTVEDLVTHYPFRYEILKRDDLTKVEDEQKIVIDGKVESIPILLRFKGGLNKLENLQTLCKSCNSSKRDNYFDYRKNINK